MRLGNTGEVKHIKQQMLLAICMFSGYTEGKDVVHCQLLK